MCGDSGILMASADFDARKGVGSNWPVKKPLNCSNARTDGPRWNGSGWFAGLYGVAPVVIHVQAFGASRSLTLAVETIMTASARNPFYGDIGLSMDRN